MADQTFCDFHTDVPSVFICVEPTCMRFLCLSCVSEHQRAFHYQNNTYQSLIQLCEIEMILNERKQQIEQNISKTLLHKNDLLLNYFFSQINEIAAYYRENLTKNIVHEALNIVNFSGEKAVQELSEKISAFLENKNKRKEDFAEIFQETDIQFICSKIKEDQLRNSPKYFPELKKQFNEIHDIVDSIEHCFLEFKKKIFSDSYALEMKQTTNFIEFFPETHEETNKNNNIHEEVKTDFEINQINFQEILRSLENAQNENTSQITLEAIKKGDDSKNNENDLENVDKIKKNSKIILENISEKDNSEEKSPENEKTQENIEKNNENLKENDDEDNKVFDDGVLIDYELEEFEYELESLKPENEFLFLYHIPLITSEYFIEILDLGCKRLFADDFHGILDVEEGYLKANKYKILLTSGNYKIIDKNEDFSILSEAVLAQIKLNNDEYKLIFEKQGLKLIFPDNEKNSLIFSSLKAENKEIEIVYPETLINLLKEKYCVQLDEIFQARNQRPLNFNFKKLFIQINDHFDKLRIIDTSSGFRCFLRSFEDGICLKDLNQDFLLDYIAGNNQHILHLEEIDIFMTVSHHISFIIFNNKFQDLMVINLCTPELILNYIDILVHNVNKLELPMESILKNFLMNMDLNLKKTTEAFLYSEKIEVLLENGDIKSLSNLKKVPIICCNFKIKIYDALKKKTIFVLKDTNQIILAFHEKSGIEFHGSNGIQPLKPYEDDLNSILRVSHYFLKLNLKKFMSTLLLFEDYIIISVLNDTSSFYVKSLKDNSRKVLLFFQQFQPDPSKYQHLSNDFFQKLDELKNNKNSPIIYKETANVQFIYKIDKNELLVRWNGNNINLYQLSEKKSERVKISKEVYKKTDREKRPEVKKLIEIEEI